LLTLQPEASAMNTPLLDRESRILEHCIPQQEDADSATTYSTLKERSTYARVGSGRWWRHGLSRLVSQFAHRLRLAYTSPYQPLSPTPSASAPLPRSTRFPPRTALSSKGIGVHPCPYNDLAQGTVIPRPPSVIFIYSEPQHL